MSENKVLIVHYRVGRTDGVSLEIEKRRCVLKEMGYDVVTAAGPVSEGVDHVVDELEFDVPRPRTIRINAFDALTDFADGPSLIGEMSAVSGIIRDDIRRIIDLERPDRLMLHNIFSHGRHIAAAKAFAEITEETGLPTQAMCHDWWWERGAYGSPTAPEVADWIAAYLPYPGRHVEYAVINSIARDALYEHRGIDSAVIPDTFDFRQAPWIHDDFNLRLRDDIGVSEGDLLLLQATRIVERKGIETAIDLAARLARPPHIDRLRGRRLYNGRLLNEDPRIVLLLAGYAEKDSRPYRNALAGKAERDGVDAVFAAERFGSRREDSPRRYSLWDAYVAADVVTYPSLHEGWGNQFIEAVFAGKPVVLFEYPVFRRDIAPAGYRFISLGRRVESEKNGTLVRLPPSAVESAAVELTRWLTEDRTMEVIEENRLLGARYHSLDRLRECLERSWRSPE